jgi:hypothetical protein
MADTYKLTAPDGTKVEVASAPRRDALLARGYKEPSSKSTKKTSKGSK